MIISFRKEGASWRSYSRSGASARLNWLLLDPPLNIKVLDFIHFNLFCWIETRSLRHDLQKRFDWTCLDLCKVCPCSFWKWKTMKMIIIRSS